nr:hypothetical protein [Kibdelosporangium sp. MJ126-NF4]CEL22693.1 hypothetical protein [Kibdelosporangium sp. MJ126-NF4]CTQ89833.1 hypothetical protein [Kibdelosporangium sp. MJ126-NF4]
MKREPGWVLASALGVFGALVGVVGQSLRGGWGYDHGGTSVLLWPIATFLLWAIEFAFLGLAFEMCRKLVTVRATWVATAVATVAIIGVVTGLFWLWATRWVS